MKTFFNLIQEVQKPGLCHHCGGCVTFCTAINYGALELGEDGKPRYKDIEKCIECGLCYSICPEIHELEEETKRIPRPPPGSRSAPATSLTSGCWTIRSSCASCATANRMRCCCWTTRCLTSCLLADRAASQTRTGSAGGSLIDRGHQSE